MGSMACFRARKASGIAAVAKTAVQRIWSFCDEAFELKLVLPFLRVTIRQIGSRALRGLTVGEGKL